MSDFADIERRIDELHSTGYFEADDSRLVAQLEDLLSSGYAAALMADGQSRRLAERMELQMHEIAHPQHAEELRSLAHERRTLDAATRRLRNRLGMVRTLLETVLERSRST